MSMKPILPGATLGMLGGGQLGRMFGVAAKRLGYKVITLDPAPGCPMAQVVDDQIIAPYDDVAAAQEIAKQCAVVTYEFENVAAAVAQAVSQQTPLFPDAKLLFTSQHRLREKQFFQDQQIPVTKFMAINTASDVMAAEQAMGYPAVLKTCQFGYDGKGQRVINTTVEAQQAFVELQGQELIWEQWVEFEKEISIVAVRNQAGEIVTYPVGENIHDNNILDTTIVPARITDITTQQAIAIANTIASALNVVGTFCVELFVLPNGNVIANEIAPRPHNSGHYTIEGCDVSQFENQVRAICGLPLGSTQLRSGAAVMINILGDGTGNTLGGVEEILKYPNVYLHLYGKSEAKAHRKMGHVTLIGDSVDILLEQVDKVKKSLHWVV